MKNPIATILLILAMAGCNLPTEEAEVNLQKQISEITQERDELREQLNSHAAEEATRLAFASQEAAIALGCDFLFTFCPEEMTHPGRIALQQGVGPSPTAFMFGVLLLKVSALGILLLVIVACIWLAYLEIIKPKLEEVDRARELIERSRELDRRNQGMVNEAQVRLRCINQQAEEAIRIRDYLSEELLEAREALEEAQSELKRSEEQIKVLEAAKKALCGF